MACTWESHTECSLKKLIKFEVHSQIFISAADLPLRVGRVDEPLRVAVHEAVGGDGRPAADESEEEEEAEDVGARAALDGAAELGVVVALLPVLVLVARSVEVLDAVAAPHGGDGIGPAACGEAGENKASKYFVFVQLLLTAVATHLGCGGVERLQKDLARGTAI